jgi:hypothetical protein
MNKGRKGPVLLSQKSAQPSKGVNELKTTNLIAGLAIAAVVAAPFVGNATVAHAAPASKPFSIAIGGNYPTSDTVRKNTTDTGLHVGLGYALPGAGLTTGTPSVDFDYDYDSGHGNKVNVYALELADRYNLNKIGESTFTPYIGGGIGAVNIDGSGHSQSRNVTNFGAKVLVGAKFSQAFVEVAYAYNGKDHGYDASDINFTIGTHF